MHSMHSFVCRDKQQFERICKEQRSNPNPRLAFAAYLLEAAIPPLFDAIDKFYRANPLPHGAEDKKIYLETLVSGLVTVAANVIVTGAKIGTSSPTCEIQVADTALHGVINVIGAHVGELLERAVAQCELVDSPITLQ